MSVYATVPITSTARPKKRRAPSRSKGKGPSSVLVGTSRFLNVREGSREFGYSEDTLRDWASRGLIGSVKINGRPKAKLLLVRADLEDLFARNLRPRRELATR